MALTSSRLQCRCTRNARSLAGQSRAMVTPARRATVAHASKSVVDYSLLSPGPDLQVEIHADEAAVAGSLVRSVEVAAKHAIAEKGAFTLAVPGGSVLKMLSGLSESTAGIDWSKVYMAYVNHKCVPLDDKSSTHKKARDYFLEKVGMPAHNVLAVRGTGDAKVEASFYEEGLKQMAQQGGMPISGSGAPIFDLMLIGMGADGHVGSLYPGKPETTMTEGWVLPVVKSEGASSITLSHPVMAAGRHIIICVTGMKKAEAVQQALEQAVPPGEMPAQMIKAGPGSRVVWLMDKFASVKLKAADGLSQLL